MKWQTLAACSMVVGGSGVVLGVLGPGPAACPVDSFYSASPHQPVDNWLFEGWDGAVPRVAYESFAVGGGAIDAIWWWGAWFDMVEAIDCATALPPFDIVIYDDDGGAPDLAAPLCEYAGVVASQVNLVETYVLNETVTVDAYQYGAALDPPCDLAAGTYWISITGTDSDPDCMTLWLSSGEGLDGIHLLDYGNGTSGALSRDLSLCINPGDVPPPSCPEDVNGDGMVDVDDLTAVILDWGTDGSMFNGDVDGSGLVDVDDLTLVILAWGPCP
jgi:hypothetical protein